MQTAVQGVSNCKRGREREREREGEREREREREREKGEGSVYYGVEQKGRDWNEDEE